MDPAVTAIVWDFDGTLVDTRRKNLNVTRALVELVKESPADGYPALQSLEAYETALHSHSDWHDFYRVELRMSDAEVLRAGAAWMEYQLADETVADAYEGVVEVLEALGALPHGIVSLNARENILRFLDLLRIDHHFVEVIGHEAVERHRQKPAPDALVMCIERLTELRPGRVLYIGDHETDALCAHAATEHFASEGIEIEVTSVGAFYGTGTDDSGWAARPHVRALRPCDILAAAGAVAGTGPSLGS